MKSFILQLILLIILSLPLPTLCKATITYEFSGGRFGDNLLSYLHAKWLSFKHDLPFLYKPFRYSDHLRLHIIEQKIEPKANSSILKSISDITSESTDIFIIPYFAESPYDKNYSFTLAIDWQDSAFLSEIRNLIYPLQPIDTIITPTGLVSVAVHVRQNEEKMLAYQIEASSSIQYNEGYCDYNDILKFPPESFYIEQLKTLANFFKENKLYVFIFTDRNPLELKGRFSSALADFTNIIFDCRHFEVIGRNNLVLEDFFSLQKFDCLIRPQSNFSLVAAKLANYLIEISPVSGYWEYREDKWVPIITKIEICAGNNFNARIEKLINKKD